MIRIRVDGIPKGQPRTRAFVRGKHAGVYDPGTADDWKACVMAAAHPHRPAVPMTGPCYAAMTFILPRPKRLKTGPRQPHASKPDIDNLAKAVLDALNHVGVWGDDAQVSQAMLCKRYAASGERAGAEITIDDDQLF